MSLTEKKRLDSASITCSRALTGCVHMVFQDQLLEKFPWLTLNLALISLASYVKDSLTASMWLSAVVSRERSFRYVNGPTWLWSNWSLLSLLLFYSCGKPDQQSHCPRGHCWRSHPLSYSNPRRLQIWNCMPHSEGGKVPLCEWPTC